MKKTVLVLGLAGAAACAAVAPNAHGQTPPPPPGFTATNTPVPPPPTATATATQVPLSLRVSLAHGTVKPYQGQKVTVNTLPGASVSLSVNYPSGQRDSLSASANASGNLTYSFSQPYGQSRPSNHTVSVKVKATLAGQSKSSTKKYTIG